MSIPPDVISPIDAALEYSRKGWRVIQLHSVGPDGRTCSCKRGGNCTSPGKHPRDNEWQRNPRLSAADIHALWEDRPKANVGIATGADSGIFVVDLDPKDNGVAEFGNLIAAHGGEFPATYVAQTGSGGFHYYFKLPDFDLRNSQSKLAPGVDIRAIGGQVVAAPSKTDKGVYTVIRDIEVAKAPSWLLELLRPVERDIDVVTAADLPKPEDIDPAEWDRLNAYAKKVIDSELERLDRLKADGWNGAPWDATTFQVACALIEIANSPWNAYSIGQAFEDVTKRAPRDNEGFDDWKVRQKLESALERVGDKARAVPASRPSTLAEDPLFGGVDVRRRTPDPTEGADPHTGGSAGPERFFGEKGALDVSALANAVVGEGPVAWGRDEAFWSYSGGVWVPDGEVVINRCVDLLDGKFRNSHAANVETVVKRYAVKLNGDPIPQWMNFRNGMVDWQTGDVLDHDPKFKSTVQFPVAWNPEAECPTFERFLADVMHADYVELAWEMIGYLMYSGNPLQVAFLLYGSGGNGKGTLIRVIEDILGRDNLSSESLDDLNSNRFSAVNLFGRIANIAGDIDGTYQESTANFKKLTGEDMYAGERKFGQRFNFQSWAVPVFSANKIPGSADVTEGYLRRWVILHFHKSIPADRRIQGLSDLLATEIEGIAHKAVTALRRLMERGSFAPKGEARKGKEEFAETIDQVRQWVRYSGIQQAPETWTALSELYSEYSIWAARVGQGRLREQELSHRLEAIGYPRRDQGGTAAFHQGLRPNPIGRPATTPADFF